MFRRGGGPVTGRDRPFSDAGLFASCSMGSRVVALWPADDPLDGRRLALRLGRGGGDHACDAAA
jgi:hypothetical protein